MAFDLTARLRLDSVQFARGMQNARRSMSGMRSGIGEVAKHLGILTGVAGAVGVAFSSINTGMEFEAQMSKVGAIADANAGQLDKLKESAMSLGASTPKSASEVAKAMEELAAKGFDTNKILGAMPGIIAASTASGEDLAMTSDVVTSALNAFGLKASAASHVADVMAMSANKTAAGVQDLGYSFKYAAPVAKTLGIKLEELSAATGMMVDKGLAGEQAGTSLRMGLMRLADAPEEASKAMDKLGFSAVDSNNKFKSLGTIVKELRQRTKGLSDAQKVQTIGTIFGTEAATGWLGLIDSAPGKLDKMTNTLVNSNGKAKEASKQMADNAKGAIEQFKGSLETLQIKLTSGLLPVIKDAANKFANWVSKLKPEQIKSWGDKIKNAGQKALDFAKLIHDNWGTIRETIVGITTAVVVFKGIMTGLKIISMINALMVAYRTGTLLATAAQWGLNTAMLANPIGLVVLAIAALVAAGVLLYRNWDTVKAKMSRVWDGIKSAAGVAVNFVIGKINALIKLINKIPGIDIPLVPKVSWGKAKTPKSYGSDGNGAVSGAWLKTHGHAGGLSRVPYNSYPALLHKNERVLTPEENKAYNGGKGGNSYAFHVTLNGSGSTEKDADKLFEYFVKKVEAAGGAGA